MINSVFRLKEIQLGLIILVTLYVSFMLSGIDSVMQYEYPIIIEASFLMLIALLINLRIVVGSPHRGRLVLTHKKDTWFLTAYKMLFFILFYTVFTLFNALVCYSSPLNRSHDILLLSLFITNIYYLILSLWTCYNFTQMSVIGDNMEYKSE